MTYALALRTIEEADQYHEMRAECQAEAGMGAVSMGWSGYDGMSVWGQTNPADPSVDREAAEAREYLASFPLKLAYVNDPFLAGWGEPVSFLGAGVSTDDDLPF